MKHSSRNMIMFCCGYIIILSQSIFLFCPHSSESLDPSHKSHNALDKYPTMHHFVTEICKHVHISVTKWCFVGYLSAVHISGTKWYVVGYGTCALWDMRLVHAGIWAYYLSCGESTLMDMG